MIDTTHIDCNEYILGERFESELLDIPFVFYSKIDFVYDFLQKSKYINNPFVLVTHNGDFPVSQNLVNFAKTVPNLKKWFGQNIECQNEQLVQSIPIGLENGYNWTKFNKTTLLRQSILDKCKQEPKKLLYLNFSFSTNTKERNNCYKTVSNRVNPNIVTDRCVSNVEQNKYPNWLDDVMNHHYVLCPRGNGLDTHRLWETLYCGRIPILKIDANNIYYRDLPILFVNEWEEITEQLLRDNIDRFSITENFNTNKLKFSWWKKRIATTLKDLQ